LALVRRIGVGDIALDVLSLRFGHQSEHDWKAEEPIHDFQPYLRMD
jgi:hypothetical protein